MIVFDLLKPMTKSSRLIPELQSELSVVRGQYFSISTNGLLRAERTVFLVVSDGCSVPVIKEKCMIVH